MTAPRTVTVSGTGRSAVVPDVMALQIGVSVVDADVSAAMDRAATSMRAMIDAMVNLGIARSDLATSQLSVHPRHHANGEPGIAGYEVTDMMTARIRRLETTGTVLSAAAEACGDDLRVHGVGLAVDESSGALASALTAARDAAFADARNRGEQYARLADARLGQVISICEGSAAPGPGGAVPRMAAYSASMPVEAGEQSVSATVDVVFELI